MTKLLLLLHILSAIIGFGTVFLNGVYGSHSKRTKGVGGLAITDATISVSNIAQWFIYAVFVTGILLVVTGDHGFDELWLSISMGLYIVGIGLSHGLLRPNVKKMRALSAELVETPPTGGKLPQVDALERRGQTVAIVSGVLNVLLVVILALMIWKPV